MIMNYLITSSQVTIVTEDETLVVPKDHLSYQNVVNALKDEDYERAVSIADAAQAINTFGEGHIYVKDGVVYYGDEPMENSLTKRIVAMVRDGFDVQPMLQFMENLMDNPSGRAVQELYRFLECNNLPITEDGYFIAYKNVSDNYSDHRTGTFDNSIGAVCEMPRNQVMDDPNVTCAAGLHFCSIEYLNSMWGHNGHTMIVKINPADVVSIPVDYNNSKGRCCRYEVIAEHQHGEKDTVSDTSVYDYDPEYDDEWYDGYDDGYYDDAEAEDYGW